MREFSWVSFRRALIPFTTVLPSWLNHPPKARLQRLSHWGLGFQYLNFGVHRYAVRDTRPPVDGHLSCRPSLGACRSSCCGRPPNHRAPELIVQVGSPRPGEGR